MNMSYCRFQNTLNDLRDCHNELQDGEFSELSIEEQKARNELVELCRAIADEFEVEETNQ